MGGAKTGDAVLSGLLTLALIPVAAAAAAASPVTMAVSAIIVAASAMVGISFGVDALSIAEGKSRAALTIALMATHPRPTFQAAFTAIIGVAQDIFAAIVLPAGIKSGRASADSRLTASKVGIAAISACPTMMIIGGGIDALAIAVLNGIGSDVIIGTGVVIGAGVVTGAGVVIGSGVVIGAGVWILAIISVLAVIIAVIIDGARVWILAAVITLIRRMIYPRIGRSILHFTDVIAFTGIIAIVEFPTPTAIFDAGRFGIKGTGRKQKGRGGDHQRQTQ